MAVKLELYRVFHEVARMGNISAAAQNLFISAILTVLIFVLNFCFVFLFHIFLFQKIKFHKI